MISQAEQMVRYGKPSWRSFDTRAEQWAEWKRQGAELATADLRRHASVSINNRHQCDDCFCCACIEVLQERVL